MKYPCPSFPARVSLAAACAVLLGTAAAFAQSSSTYGSSNDSKRQGAGSSADTSKYQSGTSSTSSPSTTNDGTATDASRQAATATTPSSDKLGFMDRRFVSKTADETQAQIQLAELASERATNPEVRSFAQKIVEDHKMANSELTTLATQKNVKLDTDDDKDRAYKRLAKKSGADFDEEFVEHMIDEHEKCIKMFEKASTNAKDADVRSFASKHVDHLRDHLKQAQNLRTSTMPTGRTDDSSGRSTSGATPSSEATSTSDTSSATSTTSGSTNPTGSSTNSSAEQKRDGPR